MRITKHSYQDHMDLLHIEGDAKQHYVCIKDFNSLMYQFNEHKERKHFCKYCLHAFSKIENLENHKMDCIVINGVQAIELPKTYIVKNGKERNPGVYFKNHQKQLPVPFVIYADFESITEKINNCQPSDKKSYTEKYQKHTACSFGYKVVCHCDEKYSKDEVIYRGDDAISKFIQSRFEELNNCQKIMRKNFNKALKMTNRDEKAFKKATHCHICERKYKPDDDDPNKEPVRDHCHITGKYRGSAHKICNLKLQISAEKVKIPVIFHNLKCYDSHFIIQQLGELIGDSDRAQGTRQPISIEVIPCNAENIWRFISIINSVLLIAFNS